MGHAVGNPQAAAAAGAKARPLREGILRERGGKKTTARVGHATRLTPSPDRGCCCSASRLYDARDDLPFLDGLAADHDAFALECFHYTPQQAIYGPDRPRGNSDATVPVKKTSLGLFEVYFSMVFIIPPAIFISIATSPLTALGRLLSSLQGVRVPFSSRRALCDLYSRTRSRWQASSGMVYRAAVHGARTAGACYQG